MPNTQRLRLEIRRSAKPFLMYVGIAVAAITGMTIAANNLTFQRPWQKYDEVKVSFADAKGIFPKGHQVRIKGVKVGVVKKAELENGKAVLTLSIEDKYGPIYKNAQMRIRPVTPLDDLYVNITDRGTPAAGKTDKNYVIAQSNTVTPVDISRVLDTFDADSRERMTILLSELGKALPDGGRKLRASFNELAPFLTVAKEATTVLNRRREDVKQLVTNFGSLSAALAKRDDQLQRFVSAGNTSLGELAANDRQLGATFAEISALLPVMRQTFASVQGLSGKLDPALQDLKPVTESLDSGLAALQKFGKTATPALSALRPAVRSLRGMAGQLNPTARSLSVAFSRLQPQVPDYDQITKLVDGCTVRLNRFFGNTMSVLKFGDANGAYPRADETVDFDNSGLAPGLNTKYTPNCTDKVGR
jgi:virulence factor Mce-like protein